MIIVLMGVAGSGKTTIGELLSSRLKWPFFDADGFHPPGNIAKMAAGIPLEDEDRWPWLEKLRAKMIEEKEAGRNAVFACSALKQSYRDFLCFAGPEVKLVYLKGDHSVIGGRIAGRKGHFMKETMLAGQFAALETPEGAVTVDVSGAPESVVAEIVRRLRIA